MTAARVTVCTTLAAAAGGLVVVLVTRKATHVWDVGGLCNGILAGLVSITAGCASVYPWQAVLIGGIGGFVYMGGSRLSLKLKIDDPLDAFAVHGCCGFWACLATGLFAAPKYAYGAGAGAFYGEGKQLGATCVALAAEIAWTSVLAGSMFKGLKALGMLRISSDVEEVGMDISKHGGHAFNYTPRGDPAGEASKEGTNHGGDSLSGSKYQVHPEDKVTPMD